MSVVLKHHIDDEAGSSPPAGGEGAHIRTPSLAGRRWAGPNSGGAACAHGRTSAPPEAVAAAAAAGPSASTNGASGGDDDGSVVVDPNVERGLAASVRVFEFCAAAARLGEGQDEAQITRAELMRLKRAGLAMNQAITRVAQARNAREDRYIIELHLLRQILQREATDRDANRARVYEMLRKNLTTDDAASAAAASSSAAASGSANPLNAPSAASLAVDKAPPPWAGSTRRCWP